MGLMRPDGGQHDLDPSSHPFLRTIFKAIGENEEFAGEWLEILSLPNNRQDITLIDSGIT